MTTPCGWGEEIAKYLDGELSQNRAKEVETHLQACSECSRHREELLHILGALAPSSGELDDPRLADDVLRRVRLDTAAAAARSHGLPWRRRWFLLPGAAALAAAAAVLLLVIAPWSGERGPRVDHSGEFTARGPSRPSDVQWLRMWVYRRASAGTGYEEVKATVRANDRLVFGYLNGQGTYGYVMILAVDRTGHVFWYHPGYERSGEDPQSIAIQRGKHELPVEVEHDLQQGRLRMFALFTRRPWRVSEVERIVGALREKKADATTVDRLPVPDCAQVSRLLEVAGRW